MPQDQRPQHDKTRYAQKHNEDCKRYSAARAPSNPKEPHEPAENEPPDKSGRPDNHNDFGHTQ